MSLLVIVPSRGRAANALALQDAFDKTCHGDTTLLFAVDHDDPDVDRYHGILQLCDPGPPGMVWPLNQTALEQAPRWDAIGFMGDDHRPRTEGWDVAVLDALGGLGTGIVYGDDLFQSEQLPTAAFMTSDIVGALGYMAPPALRHMYVDNAWLAWGQLAGCLKYLPDVVIEHVHPHAGKGEPDAQYERVWPLLEAERETWETYRRDDLEADVAKIAALR